MSINSLTTPPQPLKDHTGMSSIETDELLVTMQACKHPRDNESSNVLISMEVKEGLQESTVPLNCYYTFCIDVSNSMQGDRIKEVRVSLNQFINNAIKLQNSVHNKNIFLNIVTFNNEANLHLDWTQLTNDNSALLFKKITELNAGGSTSILNGVKKAVEMVTVDHNIQNVAKRVLVVMTDGEDSAVKKPEVLKYEQEKLLEHSVDLQVLGIGMGHDPDAIKAMITDQRSNSGGFYPGTVYEYVCEKSVIGEFKEGQTTTPKFVNNLFERVKENTVRNVQLSILNTENQTGFSVTGLNMIPSQLSDEEKQHIMVAYKLGNIYHGILVDYLLELENFKRDKDKLLLEVQYETDKKFVKKQYCIDQFSDQVIPAVVVAEVTKQIPSLLGDISRCTDVDQQLAIIEDGIKLYKEYEHENNMIDEVISQLEEIKKQINDIKKREITEKEDMERRRIKKAPIINKFCDKIIELRNMRPEDRKKMFNEIINNRQKWKIYGQIPSKQQMYDILNGALDDKLPEKQMREEIEKLMISKDPQLAHRSMPVNTRNISLINLAARCASRSSAGLN